MTKAFTEIEKTRLRERLLKQGRKLFTQYGLKKTSLEDLTRPLGIAKSTFYLFFESKEALYFELLIQMRHEVEERIRAASFASTDDPREGLRRFMRAVVDELETNPLTRRLVTQPEELELLARNAPPELLSTNTQDSTAYILPAIRAGQARGSIIAGQPVVIAGVIRSVALLTLHKDIIGEDIYPQVVSLMIDLIATGLAPSAQTA
ncbi:MAG: TetR/AcrR family transcriptional regulator [Thermoflexales bacterium]|nr:TetR/AcrR family transcriptional regulator [Thermoflexales bacterium]